MYELQLSSRIERLKSVWYDDDIISDTYLFCTLRFLFHNVKDFFRRFYNSLIDNRVKHGFITV